MEKKPDAVETGTRNQEEKGDYLNVSSCPHIMKIISKHGRREQDVLFADRVMKFTASGKMKIRILLITDIAMYLIDPPTKLLKRRIALNAIENLCLSEMNDNFFAVIVPYEYDCLMASTRRTEIVNVLVGDRTPDELVNYSNRFTYHAAADLVKELQFVDQKGIFRTRIVRK